MPRSQPLPDALLHTAFTPARARELGVTPDMLRGRRLQAPFFGVRVAAGGADALIGRCEALAARYPNAAFSHWTAAALHELPLPPDLERHTRGVRRMRSAIPLLHARSQSPMESRLRVLLVLAGLPLPEVNRDVVENGQKRRRRLMEDAGWMVVEVTADDIYRYPDELISRLRRLVASRTR